MKRVSFLLAALFSVSVFGGTTLPLSENGKPALVITLPENPNEEQVFAAKELKLHLDKTAGCTFRILKWNRAEETGLPKIFIGAPEEVKTIFGQDFSGRKDQTSIVAKSGKDVILTGKGLGMIYAVYDFLEDSAGVRWFTPYEGGTLIPKKTSVELEETEKTPNFAFRAQPNWYINARDKEYYYLRRRINQNESGPARYNTLPLEYAQCHMFYSYIRPDLNTHIWELKWPDDAEKNRNYFKDHPEYFSMNAAGKRVPEQLCFSNPEMRKELSRRLELQVSTKNGGKGVFNLSAQDTPGRFCYCENCLALEKKYGCTGGPLFDYLIEACNGFMKKYPEAMLSTLAYRKNQTEFPPNVAKMPENLLVIFCPVDNDVTKTLDHPNNAETYANLKKWCSISKIVWVWYYVYYGGPCGVTERVAEDLRLMREGGVSGTFFEFNSDSHLGLNFAPLNEYIAMRLYSNAFADPEKDESEFCGHLYGKAAEKVAAWRKELENHRKAVRKVLVWSDSSDAWGYFTPEDCVKVSRMFDEMEDLTKDEPFANTNLRILRIGSDIELLKKFPAVRKTFPEFAGKSEGIFRRISENLKLVEKRNSVIAGYLRKTLEEPLLLAEIDPKPLPAQFDSAKKEGKRIIRMYFRQSGTPVTEKMSDAAYGMAQGMEVKNPEKGMSFGFYDATRKKQYNRTISFEEMDKTGFRFYKVAEAPLGPVCHIWVHPSWGICSNDIGPFFNVDDPKKEWEMYLSLKFTGPAYGSAGEKNMVFADQVVLVEKEKDGSVSK